MLTGVPYPGSPIGDDGLPEQTIVTRDGMADLAAHLLALYQWIEAARACLELR